MPQPVTQPLADLTLRDFVARLSSAEPVPGGGSASAVAGSLAAGLVAMVAALSDRPRYADHKALHLAAHSAGERLAARLLELADRDASAYAAYAAALKLPRDSDAEREARRRAIADTAEGAAAAPLTCVEACLAVLSAAEALAGRSNVNAASDLAVASLIAEAAAQGATANVRVNLPAMGDRSLAASFETRVAELMVAVASRASATRARVASGEARAPLEAAQVEAVAGLERGLGDGSRA